MPIDDINNAVRDRIASVNIKNKGQVDVYYVGGSTFELDLQYNPDHPIQCRKEQIDELIEKGQIKLLSRSHYNDIVSKIDPVTGDTDTHYANGEPKSFAKQTLSKLQKEKFVDVDENGHYIIPEKQETVSKKPKRPNNKKDNSKNNRDSNQDNNRNSDQGTHKKHTRDNGFKQDDTTYDADKDINDSIDSSRQSPKKRSRTIEKRTDRKKQRDNQDDQVRSNQQANIGQERQQHRQNNDASYHQDRETMSNNGRQNKNSMPNNLFEGMMTPDDILNGKAPQPNSRQNTRQSNQSNRTPSNSNQGNSFRSPVPQQPYMSQPFGAPSPFNQPSPHPGQYPSPFSPYGMGQQNTPYGVRSPYQPQDMGNNGFEQRPYGRSERPQASQRPSQMGNRPNHQYQFEQNAYQQQPYQQQYHQQSGYPHQQQYYQQQPYQQSQYQQPYPTPSPQYQAQGRQGNQSISDPFSSLRYEDEPFDDTMQTEEEPGNDVQVSENLQQPYSDNETMPYEEVRRPEKPDETTSGRSTRPGKKKIEKPKKRSESQRPRRPRRMIDDDMELDNSHSPSNTQNNVNDGNSDNQSGGDTYDGEQNNAITTEVDGFPAAVSHRPPPSARQPQPMHERQAAEQNSSQPNPTMDSNGHQSPNNGNPNGSNRFSGHGGHGVSGGAGGLGGPNPAGNQGNQNANHNGPGNMQNQNGPQNNQSQNNQYSDDDDWEPDDDADSEAYFEDLDEEFPEDMEEEQQRNQQKQKRPNKFGWGADDVDWDEELAEEAKSKSIPLIILLVVSFIISSVLFFGVHMVSASIIGGQPIDVMGMIPGMNKQEQTDETQNKPQNDNVAASNNASEEQSADEKEEIVYIDRTDYDPEDAVLDLSIASEDNQNVAIGFFQAIRQSIVDGDVTGFGSIIALNQIAQEIADGYANHVAGIQKLTEQEKQQLADFYRDTLIQQEKQHVVDKDVQASIFGGRIREIREDSEDPGILYVVTESIGGDHQRACFVLETDAEGSWYLTHILEPEKYAAMIATGPYQNSASEEETK